MSKWDREKAARINRNSCEKSQVQKQMMKKAPKETHWTHEQWYEFIRYVPIDESSKPTG